MTLTEHKIWHLPLILLALWLGACSMQLEGEEPSIPADSDDCRVSLYISLSGGQPRYATRAQSDSPWDTPGSGMENYLDLENNDYRVYLFEVDEADKTGTLIADLTDEANSEKVELKIDSEGSSDNIYKITFRVDQIIEDASEKLKNFKIVMLANWGGSYPSTTEKETTITELTGELDNCIGTFDPKDKITKIPFFGVQKFENVELKSDKESPTVLNQPYVNLIRAFAKIDVWESDETVLHLTGVTLNRYNKKYHKAPLNVTEGEHYGATTPALSIPESKEESAETIRLNPTLIMHDDGKERNHYIIYVPEYEIIGREIANKSSLTIHYEDEYGDKTAEFKYYQAAEGHNVGDYYDLHRNYWYELIVKRTIMEFTVDVIPFTPVDLYPDFGLERDPFTGYIVGGKDEDGNQYWYDGNYYESAGQAGAPTDPTPLYLGPAEHPGELVTINDKRYMLVYSKPERTAADLDHFFEVFTEITTDGEEVETAAPVKHWLSYAAITGYKALTPDIYINDKGERVYIENWGYYAVPGTYNEWGIADFFPDQWGGSAGNSGYYPSFWFDILGVKHSVPTPVPSAKPTEPKPSDFNFSNDYNWTTAQWDIWKDAVAKYPVALEKWSQDNENWKKKFLKMKEDSLGQWLDYLQDSLEEDPNQE